MLSKDLWGKIVPESNHLKRNVTICFLIASVSTCRPIFTIMITIFFLGALYAMCKIIVHFSFFHVILTSL